MAKNSFQDIKKINNLKKNEIGFQVKSTPFYTPPISSSPVAKINKIQDQVQNKKNQENIKNNEGSRYGLWFVAFISIIFLLFALSFLFSSVKVLVNPKVQNLTLNENLSAAKDSNSSDLSFDLVALPGEEIKSLPGDIAKDVAIKAKGNVVIYNSFSKTPQALSIDTRLLGSNGKLYKTDQKVTVPGMNADNTPGSVKVGIYAGDAGEDYNSDPLDFKIIGFKDTLKYEKIYARSVGRISGGIKGKVSQVSDEDKAKALIALQNTLQEKLMKKVIDQIPPGFILFKDAVFLNVDDQADSFNDGVLSISMKGTLYGFLFDEKKLTKKIAKDVVNKYDGSDLNIPNIRNLVFSLSDKNINFSDIQNINFTLSGPAKIVWSVDGDKLSRDILGKSKKDFNDILKQYPDIDSADLVIRPIWRSSFPEKLKDIKIIINPPK
ncbi:MAG: hypothetical protein V4439_03125 [Patescibacteria group bacterium]